MCISLRLGFAPIHGYVWILNTLSQSGFPHANERLDCAVIVSLKTFQTLTNSYRAVAAGPVGWF